MLLVRGVQVVASFDNYYYRCSFSDWSYFLEPRCVLSLILLCSLVPKAANLHSLSAGAVPSMPLLELRKQKWIIEEAVRRFNVKPCEGVAYMLEAGLASNADEVAEFL